MLEVNKDVGEDSPVDVWVNVLNSPQYFEKMLAENNCRIKQEEEWDGKESKTIYYVLANDPNYNIVVTEKKRRTDSNVKMDHLWSNVDLGTSLKSSYDVNAGVITHTSMGPDFNSVSFTEDVRYVNRLCEELKRYEFARADVELRKGLLDGYKTRMRQFYGNDRTRLLVSPDSSQSSLLKTIIEWFDTFLCNLRYVEYNIIEWIHLEDIGDDEHIEKLRGELGDGKHNAICIVGYPDPKHMAPAIEGGTLRPLNHTSIENYTRDYATYHYNLNEAEKGTSDRDKEKRIAELVNGRIGELAITGAVNKELTELKNRIFYVKEYDAMKEALVKERLGPIMRKALNLPNIRLDYVFEILKAKVTSRRKQEEENVPDLLTLSDVKPMFLSFAQPTLGKQHAFIFETVRNAVQTRILPLFYPEQEARGIVGNVDNFYCTINMTEHPYVRAAYFHATSNFDKFAHHYANTTSLEELIYNLSIDDYYAPGKEKIFSVKRYRKNDGGLKGGKGDEDSHATTPATTAPAAISPDAPTPEYHVDDALIQLLGQNTSRSIVVCNSRTTYDVDMVLKIGDRVLHMILHPNTKCLWDDDSTFLKNYKEHRKNPVHARQIYGQVGNAYECEKKVFLMHTPKPMLRIVHLVEINKSTMVEKYMKKLKYNWGIPIIRQNMLMRDEEGEEFYTNHLGPLIKDVAHVYPDDMFVNLKWVLLNMEHYVGNNAWWRNKEFDIETLKFANGNMLRMRLDMVPLPEHISSEYLCLLLYTSDLGKIVVWVYMFARDAITNKVLNKIKRNMTSNKIQNFKINEVETLRNNNHFRSLYDLDNYDVLDSIRNRIQSTIFPTRLFIDPHEKGRIYTTRNEKLSGKEKTSNSKWVTYDLYINRLISYHMQTLHIQILPTSQYQNPLYNTGSTITSNLRLVSLRSVLGNLEKDPNYYIYYKNSNLASFVSLYTLGISTL